MQEIPQLARGVLLRDSAAVNTPRKSALVHSSDILILALRIVCTPAHTNILEALRQNSPILGGSAHSRLSQGTRDACGDRACSRLNIRSRTRPGCFGLALPNLVPVHTARYTGISQAHRHHEPGTAE